MLKELAADDPRHGTANGYNNYSCRCESCTEAWRHYCREMSHRRGRSRPLDVWRAEQAASKIIPPHGTESRYTRYKCKCDECRTAATEAKRRRRAANQIPCSMGCGRTVSALDLRDKSRPAVCRSCWSASRTSPAKKLKGLDITADQALIQRAEALEAAKLLASGELAELISEQDRDQRLGNRVPKRPWLVSLDALDRYGRELYETVTTADEAAA